MWSDTCGQHNVFHGGCTILSASSSARTTNYKMPPEEQLDNKEKFEQPKNKMMQLCQRTVEPNGPDSSKAALGFITARSKNSPKTCSIHKTGSDCRVFTTWRMNEPSKTCLNRCTISAMQIDCSHKYEQQRCWGQQQAPGGHQGGGHHLSFCSVDEPVVCLLVVCDVHAGSFLCRAPRGCQLGCSGLARHRCHSQHFQNSRGAHEIQIFYTFDTVNNSSPPPPRPSVTKTNKRHSRSGYHMFFFIKED